MNRLNRRILAIVMMLAMALTLLPIGARGADVYQQILAPEELVSGQYVLRTSGGAAPGCLEEGWLTIRDPNTEEALWTLTVVDAGVILTDPKGISIAPGENDEMGLTEGAYPWTVEFLDGMFSFHGFAGEIPVTLALCDEFGFRDYDDSLMGELYDCQFALYRVTQQDSPEEETTAPTEETTAPTEETTTPTEEPTEPPKTGEEPTGPRLYFGQLHAHTVDSDGQGTVAEAYEAAAAAGMDFFAVTDHSNSLDGAEQTAIAEDASAVSEAWRLGKEAARAAATDTFLPIYGYEMTWQNGLGHISTFFTPGFQSRKQETFAAFPTALETYYHALATVPGSVSQFNHPGTFYGDFENLGHWSEVHDRVMQLLEVSCEGVESYDAYNQALDFGWHVAPTSSQNNHNGDWGSGGRTVVWAESLTEEAFASALQNRRVYATDDTDLEILYYLDGHLFGSVLPKRQVGETVTLTASLFDPTDSVIGTVEVIVEGGAVAAVSTLEGNFGELTWQLPSRYSYYYLRITQPDGDVAVTAPVWIRQHQDAEITSFTTDTALAVSGRPVNLNLQVRNRDTEELVVEAVSFFVNGQRVGAVSEPAPIPGSGTADYTGALTLNAAGATEIRAVVTGKLDGETMECTASLSLTYLTEDLVTTLVADGSHGALPALTELEAVAAEHRMVLVPTEALTAEQLASCDLLLIPAPEKEYSEEYAALIKDFLHSGRTVIFMGTADRVNPKAAGRMNGLLEMLGLTARFRDDTAFDPVNNGGQPTQLYTTNLESSLGIPEPWCQKTGCTIDPGAGQWLVKGMETTFSIDGDGDGLDITSETHTEVVEGLDVAHAVVASPADAVLLAKEETAFGGSVWLAGGAFLGDDALDPGGDSIWESPNGNGLLLEQLLEIPRSPMPVSAIADAKTAEIGTTVRVRGFVTAGTAVPGNSFPDMIYVQDETAGLGILDFAEPGVSLGTPVEMYLIREEAGFRLLHWQQEEGPFFIHQPRKLACGEVNYDAFGDLLVQAEGKVVGRTLTEDGKGLSSLLLEDREGSRVTVGIENCIRSGSTGKNTLAETIEEGDWVSAAGIVYLSDGQTVLRVRDCDEVTVIRETDKTYTVVKGAYSVWIRKDGKSIYMEVDGPGKELIGVEVDGERISQSHYQTTESEYLIFRFWPRYLKTLSLGTHSVVFQFRDGEAKATLVVWNHADSPETGDAIGLPMAAMALSGGLLLAWIRRRKIWSV